jgi:hypothetical protein
MPDENQQKTAPDAPTDDNGMQRARAAIESIRDLFATLEPPTDVEVQDASGRVHRVRSVVAARAQIRAMQELERIASMPGNDELAGIAATMKGGIQGAVAMLVRAAAKDDVLDGLSRAFAAAHPAAVHAAAEGTGFKVMLDQRGNIANGEIVADLFPVEEVVGGLVPFFIRLVGRILGMMTKAASTTNPGSR